MSLHYISPVNVTKLVSGYVRQFTSTCSHFNAENISLKHYYH